jgi:hypothetical protein
MKSLELEETMADYLLDIQFNADDINDEQKALFKKHLSEIYIEDLQSKYLDAEIKLNEATNNLSYAKRILENTKKLLGEE